LRTVVDEGNISAADISHAETEAEALERPLRLLSQ